MNKINHGLRNGKSLEKIDLPLTHQIYSKKKSKHN
jgi:hypothetical protein